MVARRASLEDDLATVGAVESLDALDVVGGLPREARQLVARLAGLATGRLVILREMRELDDRLGLTPKGMAQLRWKIVPDQEVQVAPDDDVAKQRAERRKRLAAG